MENDNITNRAIALQQQFEQVEETVIVADYWSDAVEDDGELVDSAKYIVIDSVLYRRK